MKTPQSPARFSFFPIILVTGALVFGITLAFGSPRPVFTPSVARAAPHELLQNVAQLSAGASHTCVLIMLPGATSGGVKCWGDNESGQLGNGGTIDSGAPVAVLGLESGVVAVAAGGEHSCALTEAGGVQCWGNNGYGQLGDGSLVLKLKPVEVFSLASGVSSIAAGATHSCATLSTGAVKCWGANSTGQLGDGTTTNRTSPVAVTGLITGVASVVAGGSHTCALSGTPVNPGGVKCWGLNNVGQLGNGSISSESLTPVNVSGLISDVVGIAAGEVHTCAVQSNGAMKCWGFNEFGQLGDGTVAEQHAPVSVLNLGTTVNTIAAGSMHTCAVLSAGLTKCWGENSYGKLGDNSQTVRPLPTDVSGLNVGVATVVAGTNHTCALLQTGAVKCWGINVNGEVGHGVTGNKAVPVDVVGLTSGVKAIGANSNYSCALTTSGAVKCWGWNQYGQLANLAIMNQQVPVASSSLPSTLKAIVPGFGHNCIVTASGSARCWGRNYEGQLGDLTNDDKIAPVTVNGLSSGVAAIAAGTHHTCALVGVSAGAGGVKCWGEQSAGQLGDGSTAFYKNSPVNVSGLSSGVSAIALGNTHSCALLSTGGLKCWGTNAYGVLGIDAAGVKNTPVDVNTLTSGVISLTAGLTHNCVITVNGGVKCWGANYKGQLGDDTHTNRSTPVDVLGLNSGVLALGAGAAHTCAIMADTSLRCWGDNASGQLGDGTFIRRTIPIAIVEPNSGWQAIALGFSHTCGLTTGGGVKCWGSNENGQLGDGTAWFLTPVDVTAAVTIVEPTPTPTASATATTPVGTPATPTATNTGATPEPTYTPQPNEIAIDQAGGAASVAFGQVITLDFPPDVVADRIYLRIEPESNPPSYGADLPVGAAFRIEARDSRGQLVTHFSQPFALTVQYQTGDLAGIKPTGIAIYYFDVGQGQWIAVPTTMKVLERTFSASLDHLTQFVVLAPGPDMVYLPVIERK